MQLGLYLPGLAALSGVQSLRILDSYELVPTHLPEPALSVHRECELEEPAEAGLGAVVAESELSHDRRELLEVRSLRGENGVAFEERDHALDQVAPIAHDQYEGTITAAVRSDATASEPFLDQSEDLSPVAVLADVEFRNQLKPDTTCRIALHRDRKAAFSVDVTRDVAIQPFLLIVRTRHVVTSVNVRPVVNA